MNKPLLQARGVTKRFGGLIAVDNIDFSIPSGAIVSIIGPNGAGKTTFFNCITGFYAIDEGELDFNDTRVNGMEVHEITRLGIARTFQNIRLFNNMTAIENLMVGQESHLQSTWLGAVFGSRKTPQPKPRRAGCSTSSACAARAIYWRRTCPTATNDAWRSVVRWPANRNFCCSMSQPPG